MRESIIHNKKQKSNKGSGLGVILYGMTLLLVLLFTAINIVNSKVIENGYNSLRDAVQTASSGSVIHLLTSETTAGMTQAQSTIIGGYDDRQPKYDIYLQLALGYLINREVDTSTNNDTIIQTGEINNFIKLDHQKVVNTTMALLEDAVVRKKDQEIQNCEKYKIMMFFIEPYNNNGKKFFNIIAYGNGDYENGNIKEELALGIVERESSDKNMKAVYDRVEASIRDIVNCKYPGLDENDKTSYRTNRDFNINLNATGSSDYNKLIREMETYPHYLIVVKDFALPTIFDGDTTSSTSFIKRLFIKDDPQESSLKNPMCALNTGKIQRQVEDAGWSHDR